MAPTVTNLIAGPATLHIADFGATEPLDTAVADAIGGDFEDMGGTDDGVTLTASKDMFELRMDQIIMSPGRRRTKLDVTVGTNLAEGTLENLARAYGQSTDTITTGGTGATSFAAMDVEVEESGAEPDYYAVILRGRAPAGKPRNVIVRKALSTEEVESAYKKDDQFLIPITFAAHWVSASVKPIHIQDSTAP